MSFSISDPYSPAVQASVLWKVPPPRVGAATLLSPVLRSDDVSRPRTDNYGGLNTEVQVADVVGFYDPRTTGMRAPVLIAGGDTLPGMRHGAAVLQAGDLPAPRSKCVYALTSTDLLLMDPVLLPAMGDTPCSRCALTSGLPSPSLIRPHSMASLVFSVPNAVTVRGMLQAAGVVVPADVLLRETPCAKCVCAVFGGVPEFTDGLHDLAVMYNDAPVITTPHPQRELAVINAAYVERVLTSIRTTVNDGLKANYARAEKGRVFLQEDPEYLQEAPRFADVRRARSKEYEARALADPRGSRICNRKALAYLTGLPLSEKSTSGSATSHSV